MELTMELTWHRMVGPVIREAFGVYRLKDARSGPGKRRGRRFYCKPQASSLTTYSLKSVSAAVMSSSLIQVLR
ncbi:hypothetical protein BH11VER1_BH11VER1_13540 [soil metagenome]